MAEWKDSKTQERFIKRFLTQFWEGYESKNQLDGYWKEQLNSFVKLRDATLYIDLAGSTPPDQRDEWTKIYLEGIYQRITGRVPYVDVQALY